VKLFFAMTITYKFSDNIFKEQNSSTISAKNIEQNKVETVERA